MAQSRVYKGSIQNTGAGAITRPRSAMVGWHDVGVVMMADNIKVTRKKLSDYTPDPHNANLGSERGYRMIDDSITEDGVGRSGLVDKNGVVIAGNQTLEVLAANGIEDVIEIETTGKEWVIVKRTDTDLADSDPNNMARRMAFRDNRSQEISLTWNPEQLAADKEAGVEVVDKLWSPVELDILGVGDGDVVEDAGAQIDRAAELQEKWQVERGDVWEVGKHRLMCGDSSDYANLEKLMDGKPDECRGNIAVITDPPYAFGLASTMNMAVKSGGWHDMMNNASWFVDRYNQWGKLLNAGCIWVFTNWRSLPILMRAAHDSGIGMNSVMVWYKNWIGPGGPVGLRPTYELVCLTVTDGVGIKNRGIEDLFQADWSSHKPSGHNAEKPIELLKHLVKITDADITVDPFLGSGTTMAAAEQLGKICYGLEIDPSYCAVILQRMNDLGLSPERLS